MRRVAVALAFLGVWAGSLFAQTARGREALAAEAEALFRAQKFGEAREKWEAALAGASRRQARRWRPWVGRALEAEGNFQKALTAYQDAHDLDPRRVDGLVDLARLYDTVGLDDQALRLFEKAHTRDPHRRDIALALGRLCFQAGRLADARKLAGTAGGADARDLAAQTLLARIDEAEGDLGAAAQRWESILNQSPSGEGDFALGRLWARQDALDLADMAFARSDRPGTATPALVFERAVIAWRRNDGVRLEGLLKRLESEAPGYFPGRGLAALVAIERGDRDRARAVLRNAFPPDPGSEKWLAVLESLLK